MAEIDLVSSPLVLKINLTRDADFIREIEAVSPDTFPAGSTVSLQFRDAGGAVLTTWNAAVTSTDAIFNVDKAVVNTLIGQNPASCRLIYTDGAVDILWAIAQTVPVDG